MRILLLTNKVPYPARDGGAIATLNMIDGLSQQSHSLMVLAMSTKKHPSTEKDIPEDAKKRASFSIIPADSRIRPICMVFNLLFSKTPYNISRFHGIAFKQALIRILSEEEFEIIQLEGLSLASYLPVIRKVSSANVVMRAHNVEHKIWERNASFLKWGFRKIYFRNLAKRLKRYEIVSMNRCDAIVPISETDEKTFLHMGVKKKLFTAPFGIDPSYFRDEDDDREGLNLFFLGSLDWIPNQEGLTWFVNDVWTKLIPRLPDLTFKVAGRNAPGNIRRLLNQKGISFSGEIADARKFMVSGSIMVVPLFSGSGIRVKILEAMALKRTVITTTIGAEGINGTNRKEYILADDAEQFCAEIVKLVKNPGLTEEIGRNARQFVQENFDNLVISKNLSRFYNSLGT